MPNLDDILERALAAPHGISAGELAGMLRCRDEGAWAAIRSAAYAVKVRHCGKLVSLRALVECSDICAKDCLYCGIRKSNSSVPRYRLSEDEIVACAREASSWGAGSLALQAGEIESEANTAFYERVLERIRPLGLGVTLSLGEQADETYRRWREAGAVRYLLRIETSNRQLYGRLHPADHSWTRRAACLAVLRRLDYQVGTGVMIGLPGQTEDDLARDIVFFGETDADMIGMGPYLPHPETPLAAASADPHRGYRLGLRMIALARLYLHDVNIAATTALQALAPDGREQGVLHGANVIMPNLTPLRCRAGYRLYDGKPDQDENGAAARARLQSSLAAIGERVNVGAQGNSPHYLRRTSRDFVV